MAITSYVAGLGQPNIHGTSDLVYMLLKVPYNFCWNILGIRLWANTFGELMTRRPILEISLPNWLRFGSIHSVGIHSLSPIRPLHTITLLLTIFGIAPTILVYDLVRGWRQRLKDSHLWLLVAIIYGLVCYFMGTSIGSARSRLIGYGWPAFWLATPVLMVKYYHTDWRLSLRLLYLHVIVCWVPFVVGCFGMGPRLSIVSVTSCGVVLHYLAFRTMRRLHDADHVRSPSFVPAGKK
jgi:hypothetical protein